MHGLFLRAVNAARHQALADSAATFRSKMHDGFSEGSKSSLLIDPGQTYCLADR
jgi:hypothetical protein